MQYHILGAVQLLAAAPLTWLSASNCKRVQECCLHGQGPASSTVQGGCSHLCHPAEFPHLKMSSCSLLSTVCSHHLLWGQAAALRQQTSHQKFPSPTLKAPKPISSYLWQWQGSFCLQRTWMVLLPRHGSCSCFTAPSLIWKGCSSQELKQNANPTICRLQIHYMLLPGMT